MAMESRIGRSDGISPEQAPASSGPTLVIWAARHWLEGRRCWHLVLDRFRREIGPTDGPVALALLEDILDTLDRKARRAIRLNPCGASRLSADERLLLQAIAASIIGRPTLTAMSVETLISGRSARLLELQVSALARLIDRNMPGVSLLARAESTALA